MLQKLKWRHSELQRLDLRQMRETEESSRNEAPDFNDNEPELVYDTVVTVFLIGLSNKEY